MNWKKTLLVCAIILLVGVAATTLIFLTEPTAERSGAVRETAMLVDVVSVERGDHYPSIVATGTVEPSKEVTLSPRVGGQVISILPAFTPGGYVSSGAPLLRIDPADYENVLQQRKSVLSQAVADLNIERGRQQVARQDYELIGDTLSPENQALMLREPQLEAARSRVEAARAAVRQAELDLQRTTIRAPFDAHILSRDADVGSQVAVGDNLGRIVGLDTYWVTVPVPVSSLRHLDVPDNGTAEGSPVRIRNRTAWDEGEYREGHLYRLIGALENQTRLARLLVVVPDPLSRRPGNRGRPTLMIGSFVEASIQGRLMPNVFRLDRSHIRSGNQVWLMEDGKLRIQPVSIPFQDAQYAYVTEGLDDGDRVVITNLSTVTNGARLRLAADTVAAR